MSEQFCYELYEPKQWLNSFNMTILQYIQINVEFTDIIYIIANTWWWQRQLASVYEWGECDVVFSTIVLKGAIQVQSIYYYSVV